MHNDALRASSISSGLGTAGGTPLQDSVEVEGEETEGHVEVEVEVEVLKAGRGRQSGGHTSSSASSSWTEGRLSTAGTTHSVRTKDASSAICREYLLAPERPW